MKVYRNIDEIAIEDTRWRKLALKICGEQMLADEVLNTFYLNYMQIKIPPETINWLYINRALTNTFLKLRNKNIEFTDNHTGGTNEQDYYEYDDTDDISDFNLYKNIMVELESIEWFHAKLFKLIIIEGNSMRSIERKTGISFNTIQSSIAITKKYLKNKYQ